MKFLAIALLCLISPHHRQTEFGPSPPLADVTYATIDANSLSVGAITCPTVVTNWTCDKSASGAISVVAAGPNSIGKAFKFTTSGADNSYAVIYPSTLLGSSLNNCATNNSSRTNGGCWFYFTMTADGTPGSGQQKVSRFGRSASDFGVNFTADGSVTDNIAWAGGATTTDITIQSDWDGGATYNADAGGNLSTTTHTFCGQFRRYSGVGYFKVKVDSVEKVNTSNASMGYNSSTVKSSLAIGIVYAFATTPPAIYVGKMVIGSSAVAACGGAY